jgi:hypothetical protein
MLIKPLKSSRNFNYVNIGFKNVSNVFSVSIIKVNAILTYILMSRRDYVGRGDLWNLGFQLKNDTNNISRELYHRNILLGYVMSLNGGSLDLLLIPHAGTLTVLWATVCMSGLQ